LLNIISNRIFADKGEVLVDGVPAQENESAQRKIYLMSEKTLYPTFMKVKEVFEWTGKFYPGFDAVYARKLAVEFGLDMNKPVRGLSTGYTSIMKCIIALSVNTPYVFLDEPVLGLDANHRDLFYRVLLEKYAEEPFCCVISTHLIEEISGMVEELVIIRKGEVIKTGKCEKLLADVCAVKGPAQLVDRCVQGLEEIGTEMLGGLKISYVRGCPDNLPDGVEVGSVDLQKLFIMMTTDREGSK